MTPVVHVSGLGKNYGAITAVHDISFDIKKGEIFALIGPNGAGKSTTLRMLATLLKPTQGVAEVAGKSVTEAAADVRQVISYLPEEAGAYKNLTGRAYLYFMAGLYANTREQRHVYVARGETICALGDRLKDKISTYSKGMVRKLLLARTVMSEPALCILDEPTSGLDVVNAMEIRNTIRHLADNGMAVLLSSHNMLEIEFLSDRVGLIAKGVLHDTGTAEQLKKKYKADNLEQVFIKATA